MRKTVNRGVSYIEKTRFFEKVTPKKGLGATGSPHFYDLIFKIWFVDKIPQLLALLALSNSEIVIFRPALMYSDYKVCTLT